jgi:hypothetical protein
MSRFKKLKIIKNKLFKVNSSILKVWNEYQQQISVGHGLNHPQTPKVARIMYIYCLFMNHMVHDHS